MKFREFLFPEAITELIHIHKIYSDRSYTGPLYIDFSLSVFLYRSIVFRLSCIKVYLVSLEPISVIKFIILRKLQYYKVKHYNIEVRCLLLWSQPQGFTENRRINLNHKTNEFVYKQLISKQ